jgi:hypothetical protein
MKRCLTEAAAAKLNGHVPPPREDPFEPIRWPSRDCANIGGSNKYFRPTPLETKTNGF